MTEPLSDYDKYDALGLAALVRRREASAAELLEAAINRIERLNPRINALTLKLYERARGDRPRPAAGAVRGRSVPAQGSRPDAERGAARDRQPPLR